MKINCMHLFFYIEKYINLDLKDWERPKPNSSTGPPTTRKSSSASSPRESGTPRNQNNREMSTVSVRCFVPFKAVLKILYS